MNESIIGITPVLLVTKCTIVPCSHVNIHCQATQKFLEIVNKARARKNAGPITWKTAVKFLMARKFDVDR